MEKDARNWEYRYTDMTLFNAEVEGGDEEIDFVISSTARVPAHTEAVAVQPTRATRFRQPLASSTEEDEMGTLNSSAAAGV